MKHLFEYLIGGKKIGKAARCKFHPQTKKELQELLKELIKERGMDGDFNDIDTSQIDDMSSLFESSRLFDTSDFNGDISEWNTSNVENMEKMFYDCKKFNQDISKWDVSNVKWMDYMFSGSGFNKDISKWKTTSIKSVHGIFTKCPLLNKPEYQPTFKF